MSRHRADKIPKDEIIADLKRVAESLGFREFTQKEFLKLSQVTRSNDLVPAMATGVPACGPPRLLVS
jgi:predicted double-glycine peptidase